MRLPAKFPVICGPTAGGKTAAAVAVAHLLRDRHGVAAEVVTADAFQVYRGMDIGTAKPTPEERGGVAHHLIDLVEPTDRFTLDQWLCAAEGAIGALRARGVVPIVVGGTHLYIKALMEGMFQGPGADAALRAELEAMDPGERRAELERVDPAAAARMHPNDVRRTVRALEVYRLTGRAISEHQSQWDRVGGGRPDALLVSLQWPTEALNRRINARVKQMMERGLLEEVRRIEAGTGFGPQAGEALGYKQFRLLLSRHPEPGPSLLDETVERIKVETRRLGKNQRTWLKRLSLLQGSVAVDAPAKTPEEIAQTIVNTVLAPS
ncbi:MAG TPA: tRNA (adenosine(37)-N6)-dimethylallyltransferase MiaA [Phycisphaerales bacterium]|nr:tRNA (adenosine(37)-N6)-dimethylallyltransferase MiaA [Phycisphaerales bacterium]